MRAKHIALALSMSAAACGAAPAAPGLETDLVARWQGAWALTRTEVYSNCNSLFTNNSVQGRRVTGKGDVRFAPGEVIRVEKLSLHRARIDLLVTVDEPLRLTSQDGPFTLYDLERCRVELRFDVPREAVRRDSVEDLDRIVAEALERFDSADAARLASGWNRREAEPLPPDYERTFARYQAWKAAQVNAAVGAKMDDAIEQAARIVDRLDRNADYLAGIGDGVARARSAYFGDCDWLLSSSVYAFTSGAPGGHNRAWRNGYEDGQRLVYYLELARRLRPCFVPPPPAP